MHLNNLFSFNFRQKFRSMDFVYNTNTPFNLGLLYLVREMCFTKAAIKTRARDACTNDDCGVVIELIQYSSK